MRCEEWTERLAAASVDDPDVGDRAEFERHVASCGRCRVDLAALRKTWDDLALLPDPVVPTGPMRARLEAALPRVGGSAKPLPRTLRFALAALIALGGFLVGRFSSPSPTAPVADSRPRYLLLLHERPGGATETPEQARRAVEEYKSWARRLRSEGKLVGGEKLSDAGTVLAASGASAVTAGADRVGGYFVIRAATLDEALAIARDCPHLKRGGTVELRPIEEV